MSKKKNKKKSKARSYYAYAYGGDKKESKKDKKAAKKAKAYYEAPKLKTVKPSLDKKEAKENKKILLAPVDIPKDFTKNRAKCNHAGDLITVEKFKSLTPTYAAFTPMLDPMIQIFGESNLAICKSCYDVIIKPSMISIDEVKKAIATLYSAANIVVSHEKMKDDEIKNIAKTKADLGDWNEIIESLEKLAEAGALTANAADSTADDSGLTEEDIAKLNRASTATVF